MPKNTDHFRYLKSFHLDDKNFCVNSQSPLSITQQKNSVNIVLNQKEDKLHSPTFHSPEQIYIDVIDKVDSAQPVSAKEIKKLLAETPTKNNPLSEDAKEKELFSKLQFPCFLRLVVLYQSMLLKTQLKDIYTFTMNKLQILYPNKPLHIYLVTKILQANHDSYTYESITEDTKIINKGTPFFYKEILEISEFISTPHLKSFDEVNGFRTVKKWVNKEREDIILDLGSICSNRDLKETAKGLLYDSVLNSLTQASQCRCFESGYKYYVPRQFSEDDKASVLEFLRLENKDYQLIRKFFLGYLLETADYTNINKYLEKTYPLYVDFKKKEEEKSKSGDDKEKVEDQESEEIKEQRIAMKIDLRNALNVIRSSAFIKFVQYFWKEVEKTLTLLNGEKYQKEPLCPD